MNKICFILLMEIKIYVLFYFFICNQNVIEKFTMTLFIFKNDLNVVI